MNNIRQRLSCQSSPMKIKSLVLVLLFTFTFASLEAATMRRCMVLPIKDNVGGALGFKVFEEIEKYLKDSDWCYYTSNSEILNILANYKRNLDQVLENPRVLKIISEKTDTGSLIKIKVENEVKGVNVAIEVLGANGEDIYFKENTRLNTDQYEVIAQTIKNWLVVYEKTIPYDGVISGVLGNQFTADVGTNRGVFQGNEVAVLRPLGKRNHPLLKEIVDWETEKLGEGKIIHSTENQSQGNILSYTTKKRMRVGDWVLLDRKKNAGVIEKRKFDDEDDQYGFGKLGQVSLLFNIGKGSATAATPDVKKLGGTVLGIDLRSQLWITRKYWVGLDIAKTFGSLSSEEGTVVKSKNNMSNSFYKIKAGYKYLPMGFFYGPQIDAFMGYGSYTYSLDTSAADGITEVNFSGLMLGARGSIPLQKVYRMHLELSFLFNPSFTETGVVYGNDASTRNYTLELGGSYIYAPNMTFDLSYGINSSKASFTNPEKSITVMQSTVKMGTTFTF